MDVRLVLISIIKQSMKTDKKQTEDVSNVSCRFTAQKDVRTGERLRGTERAVKCSLFPTGNKITAELAGQRSAAHSSLGAAGETERRTHMQLKHVPSHTKTFLWDLIKSLRCLISKLMFTNDF